MRKVRLAIAAALFLSLFGQWESWPSAEPPRIDTWFDVWVGLGGDGHLWPLRLFLMVLFVGFAVVSLAAALRPASLRLAIVQRVWAIPPLTILVLLATISSGRLLDMWGALAYTAATIASVVTGFVRAPREAKSGYAEVFR